MMGIKIIKERITKNELQVIAEQCFGNVVKIAVDIKEKIIAAGGEFHSECQEALIKQGSQAEDIWGANILLHKPKQERIEFIALINIKPSFDHYDMEVRNPKIKERIQQVVEQLIE